MEKLPIEVLCKIFSYLNYDQRLAAGLVCQRWLYASRLFLEDDKLEISDGHLPDVTSVRLFTSIHVFKTTINDSCVHFLNCRRPLRLEFTDCEVQKLPSTNADCCELLSLETDSSDVLSLFQYLPLLETLNLSYAKDFNAETLENCEFIGLGLKSFSMPRFLPNNNGSSQNGQEFLFDRELILLSVEKFIRMRAETLKFVQFPQNISAQAVLRISQVENLKLESVIFPNCFDCCTTIVDFCQNQPFITALKLRLASGLLDVDFRKIFDQLPALKQFSVQGSSTLDKSIVRLFARPNMRMISINGCDLITPDSFSAAITTLACYDLVSLEIVDTQLQESHILRLLPLLPRLNTLNLSRCPLTNYGFRKATLRLTRLRKLILCGCSELSGGALSHLTSLVDLQLGSCEGITCEGLFEGVRYMNLKTLFVYDCFPSHRAKYIIRDLIIQNPRLGEACIEIF